jgi:hypothetical protein
MKIRPGSTRCHYPARVAILLIAAALIAGMLGCSTGRVIILSIDSTEGGAVTTPGEGSFTYSLPGEQDTLSIDLMAEAEQGYCFVEWTGDVDLRGCRFPLFHNS